jgi:hypothetical protein
MASYGLYGYEVRISVGASDCSHLQNDQTYPGACPVSHSVGVGAVSRGVKRPGREVEHTPPSSADVKNKWSYTSAAAMFLHGVGRDKFDILLNIRQV